MGDELGESRSPGGWISWIPEEAGVLARKGTYSRKVLPARKATEYAEELAGAGRVFCAGESAGAVAIVCRDRNLDDNIYMNNCTT